MPQTSSSLWPYPAVVSHRLGGTLAPENTMAALKKARALGVTMVETDAMLTKDGILVLSHDETLGRVVAGDGAVSNLSWKDLGQCDAGVLFSPEYAGERMCLLENALRFTSQHGIAMNLEIKPASGFEKETAVAVTQLLHAFPDRDYLQKRVLLSSFAVEALEVVFKEIPEIPRGLLLEELPPDWRQTAKRLAVKAIHPSEEFVTAAFVSEAHALGYGVMAYTVDEAERAKALIGMGVDAICTNRPDRMLTLSA